MKRSTKFRIIQVLRWTLRVSPREMSRLAGAALGVALYGILRRDRFHASRNLQIAYGDRFSPERCRTIALRAFINAGMNVADVVRMETGYESELGPLIDIEGQENFDRAYRRGRGVIAATGHIGNFELLAAYCAMSGYRTAVIGRELYDRRVDEILVGIRRANRIVNITTTEVRKFIRALREGYAVGVLIDTDSQRVRSDFLESYGRLAYSPIGQTLIGLKQGAAFAPLLCRRTGHRYLIKFCEEIRPRDYGVSPEGKRLAALDLTWRIRKLLDAEVDRDPTQWIWTHNRWNSRPGRPGRPGPAGEYPPGLNLARRASAGGWRDRSQSNSYTPGGDVEG